MSFEETLKQIVREVIREELKAVSSVDRLMTAQEVAEYLGYDVHTVYRLKRERKLQGFSLGDNSLRFYQSEVSRFIQERAS
jgi:excisionase family DNA binding protein